MGLDQSEILNRIHNLDYAAESFIKEWFDPTETIHAHTSGSTGRPKEIMLPKADMRVSARATNEFFGITEKSVMLSPLSTTYIAGKMMIVRAIVAGCTLYLEEPSNRPLHKAYPPITLLPIVPSQLQHLFDNPSKLGNVRSLLIGGAPLSPVQERLLASLNVEAWQSYGMTETCSHVALKRIGDPAGQYCAMPGISFSTDRTGRLIINAPAYSFVSLQTNDIVKLTDAHHFIWKGRADNVIISGGIKVFPEEIEKKLSAIIPADISYYVTGADDRKWGNVPVLVVEKGSFSTEKLQNEIEVFARNTLSPAERPARILFVESVPRTANGKIRHMLPSE